MSATSADSGIAKSRGKLLTVVALMVLALCAPSVTERPMTAGRLQDLQRVFASDLVLLRAERDGRHGALADRCRALVHKPRIRAALEDGAPDMLYPSAMDAVDRLSIRQRFYRFLDSHGAIIAPVNALEAGVLGMDEEKRVAFPAVPQDQQDGYILCSDNEVVEVIATPIFSMETGEVIAALVAGFSVATNDRPQVRLQTGLWLDGKLRFPVLAEPVRAALERLVAGAIARHEEIATKGSVVVLDGSEWMLFVEQLNPRSLFPAAYEVGTFPIAGLPTPG